MQQVTQHTNTTAQALSPLPLSSATLSASTETPTAAPTSGPMVMLTETPTAFVLYLVWYLWISC